jgi:hypothetical protein
MQVKRQSPGRLPKRICEPTLTHPGVTQVGKVTSRPPIKSIAIVVAQKIVDHAVTGGAVTYQFHVLATGRTRKGDGQHAFHDFTRG